MSSSLSMPATGAIIQSVSQTKGADWKEAAGLACYQHVSKRCQYLMTTSITPSPM